MTMELYRTDCTLASPTSLQLCINVLGAGVDSNLSVYSASGLDLYIDLGIKLEPIPVSIREPDGSRHDHLHLAFQNSEKLSDSFLLPHEQKLRLQAQQSACHTAAGGDELEENAQSVREPIETSNQFHDDEVAVRREEEGESTAVTNCSNGGLESEEYATCTKPLLTCPANILSQIECFDMADVSAACHLLELSSYSGSLDSSGRDQLSETYDREESPPRLYSDFYQPAKDYEAQDYEDLTRLVDRLDRLQAALPGVRPTAWMSGAKFHNMGNDASTFRKRRVRANVIKRTDVGQIYFDDWDFEVEVLERPPCKRRNRRVDIIYKRSIQV